MGTNPRNSNMSNLALKYLFAKNIVIDRGYNEEILWQSSLCFDDLDESNFLRELAWVILSSGMKEKVIRNLFNDISKCFYNWRSAKVIVDNKEKCFNGATIYFNNKPKISAIIYAVHKLNEIEFDVFKTNISKDPIRYLQEFPYIGPITVYHLAKNIGLPVAKPDRHLTRIANAEGYSDVQAFCKDISHLCGDSIPVVDLVLWRFATIERNYLIIFSD